MDQTFLSQFLFTGGLLCFLSHVTGNCTSKGVTSLNRTQGEHVLIHLDQNITKETELKLYLLSKHLLLLTFSPGESRTTRIIPRKEYEGRLSVPDDKTLMLMNVASEDSGCYEIDIRSASGKMHIQTFNLTVFGSVSTESNMNPESLLIIILLTVLIGVLVFLIAACVFCRALRRIWLNRIKGIPRRRRNIQEEGTEEEGTYNMSHREERRLEEGCELVHVTFLSDQETEIQMRTQG